MTITMAANDNGENQDYDDDDDYYKSYNNCLID